MSEETTYPDPTPEKVQNYIRTRGICCPFCDQSTLTSSGQLQVDGSDVWGVISCSNCGNSYHDNYSLSGITLLNDRLTYRQAVAASPAPAPEEIDALAHMGALLLKGAQEHSEDEPEHEVGDLQMLFYTAFLLLPPNHRAYFFADEMVTGILALSPSYAPVLELLGRAQPVAGA